MKVSDLGALGGGPDFLGDDFLEGEARNGNRNEFEEVEIIQGYLRHRTNGKNGPFAHADLQFDLHAFFVLRVRADGIGGASVIGQIPVLLAVEPE